MIFRAVVCPGAPLLIAGLADGLREQLPALVAACDRAIADLGEVDRILLLTSGSRALDARSRVRQVSVVHPPGTSLTSAVFTGSSGQAHFTGRLAGAAGSADLPAAADSPPAAVGVLVGAALLARGGIDAPVTAVELADRTSAVAALLEEATTSTDRVGLLVVAEGSANRGSDSPGHESGDADRLDEALAAALRHGDPGDLHRVATCARSAPARKLFSSAPAFLALAELTARRPPRQAELLLDEAPLEVAYVVARWSWD